MSTDGQEQPLQIANQRPQQLQQLAHQDTQPARQWIWWHSH